MLRLIFMKGRLLLMRTMLAILNKIGGLHWKNNKPNDAAIAFERAIEIDPCCTSAVLNIAFLMCGLGDYLGALKKCNDLLELRPELFIDADLLNGKNFHRSKELF